MGNTQRDAGSAGRTERGTWSRSLRMMLLVALTGMVAVVGGNLPAPAPTSADSIMGLTSYCTPPEQFPATRSFRITNRTAQVRSYILLNRNKATQPNSVSGTLQPNQVIFVNLPAVPLNPNGTPAGNTAILYEVVGGSNIQRDVKASNNNACAGLLGNKRCVDSTTAQITWTLTNNDTGPAAISNPSRAVTFSPNPVPANGGKATAVETVSPAPLVATPITLNVTLDFGREVVDGDSATVFIGPCGPPVLGTNFTFTKTPNVTTANPGETVTYTYSGTNLSDVPIEVIELRDDRLGVLIFDPTAATIVQPGETITRTATYVVQPDDTGTTITNVAIVRVRPLPDGIEGIAEAEANVTVPLAPTPPDPSPEPSPSPSPGVSPSPGPQIGNIRGRVFLDVDGNGIQNLASVTVGAAVAAAEPGFPDVTVTITDGSGQSSTARTNGNGDYGFIDLSLGDYRIVVTDPPGYRLTTANNRQTTTVQNNQDAPTTPVGYQPTGPGPSPGPDPSPSASPSATPSPSASPSATPSPGVSPSPSPAPPRNPDIRKVSDVATAQIGEPVRFTITVTNPSGVPVTDLVVTDSVPPQFAIGEVTTTTGTAQVSGQEVRVAVGTLPPQGTATIVIAVMVAEASATPIVNTARYTGALGDRTVTGSAMAAVGTPNLPNTGGGGMARTSLVGLALGVALLAVAGGGWYRRRGANRAG